MNVLRAVNVLKEDLLNQQREHTRVRMNDEMITYCSKFTGMSQARLIHIYGKPDCGKTLIAKNLICRNQDKLFLYVSKKLDDINKISRFNNVTTLNSSVFEETIEFLESIDRDAIDMVIIDNINNMVSREELQSAFTVKLDNSTIFDRYIKRISQLAAKKNFMVVIINGINLITEKSRYGYMIDREAALSVRIEKESQDSIRARLKIKPTKNRLSDVTAEETFIYYFDYDRTVGWKGWR